MTLLNRYVVKSSTCQLVEWLTRKLVNLLTGKLVNLHPHTNTSNNEIHQSHNMEHRATYRARSALCRHQDMGHHPARRLEHVC